MVNMSLLCQLSVMKRTCRIGHAASMQDVRHVSTNASFDSGNERSAQDRGDP